MVNEASTGEKRQSCREDKMSGVEQKTHLITSESKACDLISPFSLRCGLAKLLPCPCRGDEPQLTPQDLQTAKLH